MLPQWLSQVATLATRARLVIFKNLLKQGKLTTTTAMDDLRFYNQLMTRTELTTYKVIRKKNAHCLTQTKHAKTNNTR